MSLLRRRLPVIVLLTAVWVLLWGSFNPGDFVNGVLEALFVTVVLPLPDVALGGQVRFGALLGFIGHFLRDLVVASVHVAWVAIRPGPMPVSSVVRVRLADDSELTGTIVTEALTLVPGSIVIALRDGYLYAHVLEGASPAAIEDFRRMVLALEQRVIRAIGAGERVGAAADAGPGAGAGAGTDRRGTP